MSISSSIITNNIGTSLEIEESNLLLFSTTISDNTESGAVVVASDSFLSADDVIISGNVVAQDFVVYLTNSIISLDNTIVQNNVAICLISLSNSTGSFSGSVFLDNFGENLSAQLGTQLYVSEYRPVLLQCTKKLRKTVCKLFL